MHVRESGSRMLALSTVANRSERAAATQARPKQETNINAIIGWVLQGGVIISSVIIALGTLLLLLSPDGLTTNLGQAYPHSLGQIWTGIATWQPQAIIALGLVFLIATPVIRVAISIFAFAREHDRLYMFITLLVLTILITSFLLGKGGE